MHHCVSSCQNKPNKDPMRSPSVSSGGELRYLYPDLQVPSRQQAGSDDSIRFLSRSHRPLRQSHPGGRSKALPRRSIGTPAPEQLLFDRSTPVVSYFDPVPFYHSGIGRQQPHAGVIGITSVPIEPPCLCLQICQFYASRVLIQSVLCHGDDFLELSYLQQQIKGCFHMMQSRGIHSAQLRYDIVQKRFLKLLYRRR